MPILVEAIDEEEDDDVSGMEKMGSDDEAWAEAAVVTWAEYFSAFFRRAIFFLSSFVKGSFLFWEHRQLIADRIVDVMQ